MQLCWFLFTFYAQNDLLYFWCIIHLIQFISIHFNSFLFKLLLSTIVVYLVDLDQFFSFNFQKYKLLSSYICQIYTVLGAKFTQIDIITILKLTLRFRTPCISKKRTFFLHTNAHETKQKTHLLKTFQIECNYILYSMKIIRRTSKQIKPKIHCSKRQWNVGKWPNGSSSHPTIITTKYMLDWNIFCFTQKSWTSVI